MKESAFAGDMNVALAQGPTAVLAKPERGPGRLESSAYRMAQWLRSGQVKYREDITDGLENAPRELIGLLRGENFGKKIIRVSPDPTRR